MSREVRKVPKDWEHPRGRGGRLQPMYGRSYAQAAREWMNECMAWERGDHPDAAEQKTEYPYYWQWSGSPPDPEYYMPQWSDWECTHFQMYETTSEGTPISPVMETPEALARWLADNDASAFGGMTATYEQWLRVCNGGWAPSAVAVNGQLTSGVAALAESSSPLADAQEHTTHG